MKKEFVIPVMIVLFSCLGVDLHAQADSEVLSKRNAKKWFRQKEWLHNVQLKPHKSINKQEFARQYGVNKSYWDKAFLFLKEHDLQTIRVGKYIVDSNNVTVAVTEDLSKDFDKTNWESHRKFIDVQCLVEGKEKMGVSPITEATVTNPYNESKDVANYKATGKYYVAKAGTFFIFFPSDVHRPNIAPSEKLPIKKVVVKVRAAE